MEYLPRIHHIATPQLSPRVTVEIERRTRKKLDGLSSCRCSTTSHGDLWTITKNANQVLNSCLSMRKRLSTGQWSHSLDLDQKKKWSSTHEDNPQGEWERIAQQMMLTFAESKHRLFRSTSSLSRRALKTKGGGKLTIHY